MGIPNWQEAHQSAMIVNEVTWGIPTGRRHTSWLLTSARAKELITGLKKDTPDSVSPFQKLLMYLDGSAL